MRRNSAKPVPLLSPPLLPTTIVLQNDVRNSPRAGRIVPETVAPSTDDNDALAVPSEPKPDAVTSADRLLGAFSREHDRIVAKADASKGVFSEKHLEGQNHVQRQSVQLPGTTEKQREKSSASTMRRKLDDDKWDEMYRLLFAFKALNGHTGVPWRYAVNSIRLGFWVCEQRQHYKCKQEGKYSPLTDEREHRLNDIGFAWSVGPGMIAFDDKAWEQKCAWEQNFRLLLEFKAENGHSRVPCKCTVKGVRLGAWVGYQRAQYKQKQEGKPSPMTDEREQRLHQIGFALNLPAPSDDAWEQKFRLLLEFKAEIGHTRVPRKYTVKGVRLGDWVGYQRAQYKQKQEGKPSPMTDEREQRLHQIGFALNLPAPSDDAWEQKFRLLLDFKAANGHTRVPKRYTVNSVRLGFWVSDQRKQYKYKQEGKPSGMTDEREQRLHQIGFAWVGKNPRKNLPAPSDDAWEQKFRLLLDFKAVNGHTQVPTKYAADGIRLGNWVKSQRRQYKYKQKGKPSAMTEKRERKLTDVGFVWIVEAKNTRKETNDSPWEQKFLLLLDFKAANGHTRVPKQHTVNGIHLGSWVSTQRIEYKYKQSGNGSHMTNEREERLNDIGFVWIVEQIDDSPWERTLRLLLDFKTANGHTRVPKRYIVNVQLGTWVDTQRKEYRYKQLGKGSHLTDEREERLGNIGFVWHV